MQKHFALITALIGMSLMLGTSVSAQSPTDTGAGFRRGIMQQNNSGQVGEVTLYPRGDKTLVIIRMQDVPPGHVEPAHVHRGHSCDTLDPKPAFPLNPVVNGRSESMIPASASRLLSGNYVVNVHISPQNIKHYVACGELTPGT